MAEVRIVAEGRWARIFVDGKEVNGVRAYQLSHSWDGVPTLNLEIVATEIHTSISDCIVKEADCIEKP